MKENVAIGRRFFKDSQGDFIGLYKNSHATDAFALALLWQRRIRKTPPRGCRESNKVPGVVLIFRPSNGGPTYLLAQPRTIYGNFRVIP